ncbi:MAG: LysE family transporter [Gammaproteobacteria bacterium]|nr:LysE family transporter [Gammaproteobacteria bacterium]
MQEFLSISLLILLVAISPGPDFVMVTKNALLYSRKIGVFTALGIAVSLLIHASYCILGLAFVISRSLLVFSMIKYLGAAYLIYIGIKSLLAKREMPTVHVEQSLASMTAAQAFNQGLLCNLLNPKAIMFLLAFFTLVLKPGHSLIAELGYGLDIFMIHMCWFSLVAYLFTHSAVKSHLNRVQFYVSKAMGALLIFLGVRIATLRQMALLPTVLLE